jgi:DNA-directed RNA polymerase specialized sigma subunit
MGAVGNICKRKRKFVNIHNQTLRKRSLARKRLILRLLNKGKSGKEIAAMFNGISHQRVYQLAKQARKELDDGKL